MNYVTGNIRSKVLVLFILIAWGIFSNALAQDFVATVDRTTVGQSDRFQVYFTFNGSDVNSVSSFRSPTFQGFRVLSGPNQSTSMQIINGKVSGSLTYSFLLQPSDIGEFTIGSASVEFAGKTYKTSPLKIKVEKGTPQQQKESTGGYTQEELGKNVFIIAEANKSRALLGEQITVTYKLYTKLNISSPQITKLPTYQGFWAEEVDPSQTIAFDIGMYKGERYRVATIKRVALFPTKTGTLNVTPFELNIPVIVKKKKTGNDIFDEFFNDSFFGGSETINFLAKSNTLKVEVEPLPTSNVPASFKGAVGNFNFKTEIDKNNAVLNESITLKLTIAGTGNIKLLEVPEIKLPAGFEKYDPKVYENVNKGAVISGQKIVEYLIVPRSIGEKEIQPVEFSYFNLSNRRYVALTSQAFKINVKQGEGSFEPVTSGFSKEDVRLLSDDIRFIKTSSFDLEPRQEISLIKPWFWIILVLPIAALLTAVGFRKRQDKLYGNVQLLKYQKAEKSARIRLKSAKRALSSKSLPNFYTELSQALYGYLEDKLGIPKAEFTLEMAIEKLSTWNVEENLIERLRSIAQKCEYVRFAPQGGTSESANDLYEETVIVIVKVDSSLERRR